MMSVRFERSGLLETYYLRARFLSTHLWCSDYLSVQQLQRRSYRDRCCVTTDDSVRKGSRVLSAVQSHVRYLVISILMLPE